MDHVVRWLADEDAVFVRRAEKVIAIDSGTACGRKAPRERKARHTGADREQAVVAELHGGAGDGRERIALEVMFVERVVVQRRRIHAAEPVAPIVARAAKLRAARDSFDQALIRADSKIAAADVHDYARLPQLHLAPPAPA